MNKTYMDKVHTWGRIWCIASLIFFLSIPLAISLHLGVWPKADILGKGLASIAFFFATGIIEVVAYSPMLGAGGTYLSFVTGNIMNLKMPCALNAMENAKVKANTEEGEVITTIAISASIIVTTLVIAVFVIIFALNPGFSTLMSSDTFAPAFQQVTYTIFGSLAATYFVKHWKISIFPIAAITLLLLFVDPGIGVLIPVGVVLSMLGAHVMYKLKKV
ncbi:MAG: hypothetical protein II356_03770 [Clostridia bacterium]|nr:hypothetical protein [Clostridia bacterium]MBQ1967076.1 hypothetical protein [Clostridia bacterium]MBQ1995273.1 hypothetical protein [Clostridia bacterium]MBQ5905207.1 hypothetical protein [Clostridia bacterium]